MNRIRIGLALTMIIGVIYAAAGLFDSLTQVGIGVVVASLAVIGYGLCDCIEASHDHRIADTRRQVWERRDQDAA